MAFWYPDASNTVGLDVGDTAGTNLRKFTSVYVKRYQAAPNWSQDGNLLAFVGIVASTAELYVVDSQTGVARALTSGGLADSFFGWSSDGSVIYFSRYSLDSHDESEIFSIRPDGTDAIQLTHNAGTRSRQSG